MSREEKYEASPTEPEAFRQCEIISGLVQSIPQFRDGEPPAIDLITHPFALVISQDCDLDLDYLARKRTDAKNADAQSLPNILFCMVVTAEQLKGAAGVDSRVWARVKINKDERYHFFEKVPANCEALSEGLPELGIDFKRYFTIPTDDVYNQSRTGDLKRRCCLLSPYLEHCATRFGFYQSRIALPEDHSSQPG